MELIVVFVTILDSHYGVDSWHFV